MIKILLFYLYFGFNLSSNKINITKSNINPKIDKSDIIYNSLNSNNVEGKKNIILGTIMRYSLNKTLPFFNSLINSNFKSCDIVMFIKDINQKQIDYLKNIGVILLPIPTEYKKLHITKLRWKLYLDYLIKRKNEYNLVFTTDIRDVLFQKDIFQYYKENKSFLGVALEDNILNEKTNKMWIKNFAGIEKHRAIKDEKIICFGTIWGTMDKILEFIKILWDKIKFDKNSTDQGIGNYLIYYEKIFNDCLIKSDNYGPVISIGWNKRDEIILDSNDNILNFKGEIASVVHQYDRHKDILKKIRKKFSYINYTKVNNFIAKNITKNKNETSKTYQYSKNKSSNKYYKNIINLLTITQFLTFIFLVKKINPSS